MNLGRKNVPTYDQSSPELPPVSTRFDNPYSSQSSPATYTKQSSIPIPGGGGFSKSATSSPLPPGGRTISAAAFRKAIPRKESTLQISGSPLGENGPDSRPLPTVPLDDREYNGDVWDDGSGRSQDNYSSGRFVTNLENEWR
ncbi:hypothetical protein M378DRAFT_11141 [Amanita muscaria Koide BX008]|uniref:Uncharacterized protein n=1 Tax=Amanita muscaria (strain Koide BX008) TaxID=946122 RepID=A0A0C2SPA7_AMAMK|nr:hypothetical protein M378DRAFT_11141 [Amanita muscaria Koide BX008]